MSGIGYVAHAVGSGIAGFWSTGDSAPGSNSRCLTLQSPTRTEVEEEDDSQSSHSPQNQAGGAGTDLTTSATAADNPGTSSHCSGAL